MTEGGCVRVVLAVVVCLLLGASYWIGVEIDGRLCRIKLLVIIAIAIAIKLGRLWLS